MTLESQDFKSSNSTATWTPAALDFSRTPCTDFVCCSYTFLLAFVYFAATLARKNKLTINSFRRMFVVCTL